MDSLGQRVVGLSHAQSTLCIQLVGNIREWEEHADAAAGALHIVAQALQTIRANTTVKPLPSKLIKAAAMEHNASATLDYLTNAERLDDQLPARLSESIQKLNSRTKRARVSCTRAAKSLANMLQVEDGCEIGSDHPAGLEQASSAERRTPADTTDDEWDGAETYWTERCLLAQCIIKGITQECDILELIAQHVDHEISADHLQSFQEMVNLRPFVEMDAMKALCLNLSSPAGAGEA